MGCSYVTKKQNEFIVDDDPDVILTMKITLKDEGFEVDTFDSPQLALSSFKPDFYDTYTIRY